MYIRALLHMSIVRKVKRVQGLFGKLEQELSVFQQASGIHCLLGCGHCCNKPDIQVAVLEFLPFAFDLYLKKETQIIKDKLATSAGAVCMLYQSLSVADGNYFKGKCSDYNHRALICRLFGFGTTRNKTGQKVLSTCKWIKSTQADNLEAAQPLIDEGVAPHYTNYYQQLVQIDFKLGQQYLPINEAMLKAIEEVEHYYNYRAFPYRFRKLA